MFCDTIKKKINKICRMTSAKKKSELESNAFTIISMTKRFGSCNGMSNPYELFNAKI